MIAKSLVLIFFLMVPCVAYTLERPGGNVLDYALHVSVDVKASTIRGVATIPVIKGRELRLHKGRLRFIQVTIDNRYVTTSDGEEMVRILPAGDGTLVIRYEGVFKDASCGELCSDAITDKNVFLTGTWYPKPEQMCQYHLTTVLPEGYQAISEAEAIEQSTEDGRNVFTFSFPHPLDGVNLIASDRYRVTKDRMGGVEIYAYFFPEDGDLAKTFVEHAKRFLKQYDRLINPYPYKRFSVVENSLPVGYSMPTYTVLGQAVVRLPFIPQISLGHEILHQWFGNSVYIDHSKGNWAEGLTSFLADHLYEDEKGRGWEYRKGVLIDLQSYVNEVNEFPLRTFTARTDSASEAIGYGKALMVFQMLKNLVGQERFYEAIRYFTMDMRFKKASWDDIERAVERYYGKDLGPFFSRWVTEKGLPDLRLEETEVKPSGSGFEVAFTVLQKGNAYTLELPVAIYSDAGKTTHILHLSKEKERFSVSVKELPQRIVLDEDYDLGRRLSVDEFPPVVARLLGDESPIVVLPSSKRETYEEVVATFKAKGGRISEAKDVTFEDLKTHSLIILGAHNPVIGALYGAASAEGGFSVDVRKVPWNHWKVAGILNGRSTEEVNLAFRKISHYGKYSLLRFDQGTNVFKDVETSARGIGRELYKEAVAVDVSAVKTLPAVMERVAHKKIIYVGETHDVFSHHVMELEIIKSLHRRGRKMAIGMEMFDKRFQGIVDEYVGGRIDEKAFLKGTEYFTRWGFDYSLYRPILLFARSEGIPVVALNQRREIVDKVFKGGLESLSGEEKALVPSLMDFSDDPYRERLGKVFRQHSDLQTNRFDSFYQAQILWDETMSESVSQFLKAHPDYQMVVLAGRGHLEYGSGIPARTTRRTGYDHAIILNDGDIEKGAADFVLFPGTIAGGTSPRLMVLLKEGARRAEISGFVPQSAAERAGMRVGDTILAIDQTAVETVDDVKIELLSRTSGERVRVRVLRRGLMGFNREMVFTVVLQ